jgi:hypothetical protein
MRELFLLSKEINNNNLNRTMDLHLPLPYSFFIKTKATKQAYSILLKKYYLNILKARTNTRPNPIKAN